MYLPNLAVVLLQKLDELLGEPAAGLREHPARHGKHQGHAATHCEGNEQRIGVSLGVDIGSIVGVGIGIGVAAIDRRVFARFALAWLGAGAVLRMP